MEIEVSRDCLVGSLFALFSALVLVLGFLASPRVNGHPVLLSPGNMAVKRYLDRADRWNRTCTNAASTLSELGKGTTVSDIYSANKRLTAAMGNLERVYGEMQAAKVPESMSGLHDLGVNVVKLELSWAHAVGAMLSAPTKGNTASAMQAREDAVRALRLWSETLKAQEGKLRAR